MSYAAGLGYDLPIKTPIGTQTISVPIEAMAEKAVASAWPSVEKKLNAVVPKLLDQAQAKIVNDLWPKMQPKLRGEVNYALNKATDEGWKLGLFVGAAVIASTWAAAYWVKKR